MKQPWIGSNGLVVVDIINNYNSNHNYSIHINIQLLFRKSSMIYYS